METTAKQFRKRNDILSCLRQSKAHPSAQSLYQALQQEHSDISLATVYRNLALFKEQGLIVSLGTVNGIERFDGCLEPHTHFACTRCGSVVDVSAVEVPESVPRSAAQLLDCRVDGVQLMLSGICRDCLHDQKTKIN